MRGIGLVGVLLGLLGASMLVAPRPTLWVLRLLGVRPRPHEAQRFASWGLLVLGAGIVVLARLA
jgi:hypothetical protein